MFHAGEEERKGIFVRALGGAEDDLVGIIEAEGDGVAILEFTAFDFFAVDEQAATLAAILDIETIGFDNSYEIIFRSAKGSDEDSLPLLLTRMEHITSSAPTGGGLLKVKRLLEATSLLHSQLPLDVVLGHMLDHAVSVTDADCGLLLETDSASAMKVKLARRSGGLRLPPESLTPSQTAIQLALKQQSPFITEDLAQADVDLQAAQSIVAQRLRAVVVIPLYALSRASTQESMVNIKHGDFLGVLYLDSRRPAAFSKLDRQILDALAADAATILDI